VSEPLRSRSAPPLQIWIDAEACPAVIKDILYRAADRVGLHLILVANKALPTPASPWIRAIQVARGLENRHTENHGEHESGVGLRNTARE